MLKLLRKCFPCLLAAFTVSTLAFAADAPKKRAITLDDLAKLQRVGGPSISKDGEWILYTVGQVDTKEDKSESHLWMVKWDGSEDIELTYGKEGGAGSPQFSPDGKWISFTSSRPGPAKGDQVWVMDRRGGEAQQFTAITDQNIRDTRGRRTRRRCLLHPPSQRRTGARGGQKAGSAQAHRD